MKFSQQSNLLGLLYLGLATLVPNILSQSPSFQCNSDAERPFGFCRWAKSLNPADNTASVYSVARSNVHRTDNSRPWDFDCKDLVINGVPADGPAKNAACCDQNYNLKIVDRGVVHDMSNAAFDRHCTVIAIS